MSPGKTVRCLVLLLGAVSVSWAETGEAGDDAGTVILDTESTWRMHVTLRRIPRALPLGAFKIPHFPGSSTRRYLLARIFRLAALF